MAVADRLSADYEVLTSGCGLLDRSERGKLSLTGAGAKEFLNGQVTNDVEALTPGRGVYAAFLSHKGKMLGDLRVLDLGSELFLDTERVSLQELFNLIRRSKIGFDVELHKRTVERGLLSLLGPEARSVAGAGELGPDEHDTATGELAGIAVTLVATDVGVDLLCDAERSADLTTATIPQEAGIDERAVSFTKGCYIGQETVARLHYKGKPNRHLRGLRLSGPAATGEELHLGDRAVGRLGTVAVSPVHGPIALAIVRREAAPDETLRVGDGAVTARVVELPF